MLMLILMLAVFYLTEDIEPVDRCRHTEGLRIGKRI